MTPVNFCSVTRTSWTEDLGYDEERDCEVEEIVMFSTGGDAWMDEEQGTAPAKKAKKKQKKDSRIQRRRR